MSVIDVQVHVYERNHPGRPWIGSFRGPDEVTGEDMIAAMDKAGVDAAVLVSMWSMYRYDPSYALEVRNKFPERFCVVASVDPDDPGVEDGIASLAKTEGLVGLRVMLSVTTPSEAGINRVLAAAAKNNLPVNFLCHGHLGRMEDLAEAHPDTQIVIDHLGLLQPGDRMDPFADLPKLLRLADYDNVAVKVSGACTLARSPFPYRDLWDPLFSVFDAFGFDRCMWGTDWTRSLQTLTYKQGTDAFRVTNRLSDGERDQLMGDTLERIYKWSPP